MNNDDEEKNPWNELVKLFPLSEIIVRENYEEKDLKKFAKSAYEILPFFEIFISAREFKQYLEEKWEPTTYIQYESDTFFFPEIKETEITMIREPYTFLKILIDIGALMNLINFTKPNLRINSEKDIHNFENNLVDHYIRSVGSDIVSTDFIHNTLFVLKQHFLASTRMKVYEEKGRGFKEEFIKNIRKDYQKLFSFLSEEIIDYVLSDYINVIRDYNAPIDKEYIINDYNIEIEVYTPHYYREMLLIRTPFGFTTGKYTEVLKKIQNSENKYVDFNDLPNELKIKFKKMIINEFKQCVKNRIKKKYDDKRKKLSDGFLSILLIDISHFLRLHEFLLAKLDLSTFNAAIFEIIKEMKEKSKIKNEKHFSCIFLVDYFDEHIFLNYPIKKLHRFRIRKTLKIIDTTFFNFGFSHISKSYHQY